MPTYDYQCIACQHITERFHSIKDNPKVKCPKCNHKTVRLISRGAGVIFKGTGFYETDYKHKE